MVKIEVIDIDDDSSDEVQHQASEQQQQQSRQNGISPKLEPSLDFYIEEQPERCPGPSEILERQRKRIDDMLDFYAALHNRLLTFEPKMNPEQRDKWLRHLSSRQKPIPNQAESMNSPERLEMEGPVPELPRRRVWEDNRYEPPLFPRRSGMTRKRRTVSRKKTTKRRKTTTSRQINAARPATRPRTRGSLNSQSASGLSTSSTSSSTFRQAKAEKKPTRIATQIRVTIKKER